MPKPSDNASDNDFEKRKWLDEMRLREQELEIKAREADIKAKEVENASAQVTFTRDEARRNRWTNPLVVAVLAAAIAGAGNAIVALLNGYAQRETEEIKEDQGLILEAIKANNDPDKAAVNLRFMADTALISNQKRRVEIQSYLKTRKPGEGPALPSTGGLTASELLAGDLFSQFGGSTGLVTIQGQTGNEIVDQGTCFVVSHQGFALAAAHLFEQTGNSSKISVALVERTRGARLVGTIR